MKKNILLFLPILLLTSCGLDAQQCRDENAEFPTYTETNFEILNEHNFNLSLDNTNEIISDFADMPKDLFPLEHQNENSYSILDYANDTNLIDTAKLPASVKYQKLFDGQVSCAGPHSNSRLGLYSSGIIIDLKRKLVQADGVVLYMSSNYLILKIKATLTLYKEMGKNQYDAFNFIFDVNLAPTVLGPNFFYFNLKNILSNTNELQNTRMIGFGYERLPLTEEEKNLVTCDNDGNNCRPIYMEYLKTQEEEENKPSFVKMYDMSFPLSTWKN